jgi:glycine betaine/proline transport system substrate-binding protein
MNDESTKLVEPLNQSTSNPPNKNDLSVKKGYLKKIFLSITLFLVIFISFISVYLFLGKRTLDTNEKKISQKPVIKLAVNPWQASELNAQIAKILLEEQMGFSVQLIPVDEFAQWESLAKGDIDASLEIWPSGHKNDINKYIKSEKTVEDAGGLGPIGKMGWYIPMYLRNEHPELTTWEGFKDPKNIALFADSGNGVGQFYTGDPTWIQYDDQIIKNLGLNFEVKVLGSEDALIKKVDIAYNQKKPIVFYFWTPHWAHVLYDLAPVQLPVYTDECYSNLKGGVNCDYPSDQLMKVFWIGFKNYAPTAYQFLKNMNYTNQDQIGMLASVQIDKNSVEQVARNWITKNESVWKLWIP